MTRSALEIGADNIVHNCAALTSGESVLLIHEDPALGWYDLDAPMAVADAVRKVGIEPTVLKVGQPSNESDPVAAEAIAAHDCTIFFARLGDQDRFADPVPGRRSVMSYARNADTLGSNYGTIPHGAFYDFKEAVNEVLLGASHIRITCPLGTDVTGGDWDRDVDNSADVSVMRFPIGVPHAIGASGFTGRVALARYLTSTGSKVYHPDNLAIFEPVFAEIEGGRITGFTGDADGVADVEQHYKHVSETFGIEPNFVHSWHAGIHPGCSYGEDASVHPDRWSNNVFTHPRFLHFHTCGAYPPGEICWMVQDHTVTVDGTDFWKDGQLQPAAFGPTADCLEKWPALVDLFANPSDRIGLD